MDADDTQKIRPMGFSEALQILKTGRPVRRARWASGMFLTLVPGSIITVAADRPLGKAAPHLVGTSIHYRAHLDVYIGAGSPTMCSRPLLDEEILADDWTTLPDPADQTAPTPLAEV